MPSILNIRAQLLHGNVLLQTLAIFTETKPGSTSRAEAQVSIFQNLPALHPEILHLSSLGFPKGNKIHIVSAFENASGFAEENEPLEHVFDRFERFRERLGPILYVSLTWNTENRFGGGNLTQVGLKKDGEAFLEFLSGKRIAIDMSHTSDPLAYGILDYIDKRKLKITPIASHSNFRGVINQPRNLPDAIAKEILRRGGIIGLNFVRRFVGSRGPEDFLEQVAYAQSLEGLDQFCLGADFFCESDGISLQLKNKDPFFFEHFDNSSCYCDFFQLLGQKYSRQLQQKIAFENVASFLEREAL